MVSQVRPPGKMTWRQARKLLWPNSGIFSVWNRRRSYVCDTTIPDFPIGSVVNNLPAIQETQVWSLGQEDPLEKKMGTHSGSLAWEIPWTEEPGGLQSMGSQELETTEWLNHRRHYIPGRPAQMRRDELCVWLRIRTDLARVEALVWDALQLSV